jgi:hypothetical protein
MCCHLQGVSLDPYIGSLRCAGVEGKEFLIASKRTAMASILVDVGDIYVLIHILVEALSLAVLA